MRVQHRTVLILPSSKAAVVAQFASPEYLWRASAHVIFGKVHMQVALNGRFWTETGFGSLGLIWVPVNGYCFFKQALVSLPPSPIIFTAVLSPSGGVVLRFPVPVQIPDGALVLAFRYPKYAAGKSSSCSVPRRFAFAVPGRWDVFSIFCL